MSSTTKALQYMLTDVEIYEILEMIQNNRKMDATNLVAQRCGIGRIKALECVLILIEEWEL